MNEVPFYRAWYKVRLGWTWSDKIYTSLQRDPSWPHSDRSLNARNDGHRASFTRYLMSELEGEPELQRLSLPNYPPFGKRMLLDNGWFAALRRDDVDLVGEGVRSLDAAGIVTESGQHVDVDVVALCTGYAADEYLKGIEVVGRGGRELHDLWGSHDARAYLGMTVPGFPNMLILNGPNLNTGAGGSYFFVAECQADYIVDMVRELWARKAATFECGESAFETYNAEVDAAHEHMIWTHPGMTTYYRNTRGRVVVNMPFRNVEYWRMTRHADLDEFHTEPRRTDGAAGVH